jgi:signal peptidase I
MRTVLVLLLLSVAAATRFLSRYVVVGESMLPAYEAGDRLMAESLSYRLRQPRVGEAAIVVQPGSNGRKDLKRVAAGPGATVDVRGEARTLGTDEWFVLGDNRNASTDSCVLGPVRRKDILGRVWFQY